MTPRYILFNKKCMQINIPAFIALLAAWILTGIFIIQPYRQAANHWVGTCCHLINYEPCCVVLPCQINVTVSWGNNQTGIFPLNCDFMCLEHMLQPRLPSCKKPDWNCWIRDGGLEMELRNVSNDNLGVFGFLFIVFLSTATCIWLATLCMHMELFFHKNKQYRGLISTENEGDFNMYSDNHDEMYEKIKTCNLSNSQSQQLLSP